MLMFQPVVSSIFATRDRSLVTPVYARFRTAGTGAFDSPVALSKNGNSYNLSSRQLVADTEYDVQVYYVDDSGNTVISQWHRFTTAPTANLPGDSVETYGAGRAQRHRISRKLSSVIRQPVLTTP